MSVSLHKSLPRAIGSQPLKTTPNSDKTALTSDSVSLDSILELFTDKYTKDISSRHVASLKRLAKSRNSGFKLKEVGQLTNLLEILKEKIETEKDLFMEPLLLLLECMCKPFVLENSYEMIDHKQNLVKLYAFLYEFPLEENVNSAVASCVSSFLFTAIKSPSDALSEADRALLSNDVAPLQYQICVDAGISARLINDIKSIFDSNADNTDVRLMPKLAVCRNLSLSKIGCFDLVKENIAQIIPSCFCDRNYSSELVVLGIEIIWNLLQFVPEYSGELCTLTCLSYLHNILLELFRDGFRTSDKEFRNEILTILLLFSRNSDNHVLFLRSNILEYLLLFSSCHELNRVDGEFVKPFMILTSDADLEMKLIMWQIIRELVKNYRCLSRTVQFHLMDALLMHFDLSAEAREHPAIKKWIDIQKLDIQSHALLLLAELVSLIPLNFAHLGGYMALALFVAAGTTPTIAAATMNVLAIACKETECVPNNPEFFAICMDIALDESQVIFTRTCAFEIMALLCEAHAENKIHMKQGIIRLVPMVSIQPSASLDPLFMISLVNAIWSCIVGDSKNEAAFRLQDGIDSLIYLLYSCPVLLRRPILGLLSDLFFQDINMKIACEWKHKDTGENIMVILLKFWSEQETMRGGTPCLLDIAKPLGPSGSKKILEALKMGIIGKESGVLESQVNSFKFDLIRKTVGTDLRPALYSVIERLKFDLNFPTLTNAQRATLILVSKFPVFQNGETWKEIQSQLERENIRPITPDKQVLQDKVEALESEVVLADQAQQIELNATNENEEVEVFYSTIISKKDTTQKSRKHGNIANLKRRMMAKDDRDEMLKTALVVDATFKNILGTSTDLIDLGKTKEVASVKAEGLDHESAYLKEVLNDKTLLSMSSAIRTIKSQTK